MSKFIADLAAHNAGRIKIPTVSPPPEEVFIGRFVQDKRPEGSDWIQFSLERNAVLVVAGFVSLVRKDSLGKCCYCEAHQFRRYNFQPGQVIQDPRIPEIDGKSVRIFLPRKANQPRWWKRGWLRKMIVTPSYHEPTGWVHIWPETCCSTPHCNGETWQVPLGRDGYRKFGLLRWWFIKQRSRWLPQTFRMHLPVPREAVE